MNHLVVFLHGIGGSRADWEQENDYTHGNALLDKVREADRLDRCYDLYGHGAWKADEADFNPEYIDESVWPKFIRASEDAVLQGIESDLADHEIGRVTLVSYSGSAIISLRVANRISQDIPITCIMAAPDPAREFDDEYSLYNQINKRPLSYLILFGRNDEEINLDDLRYVYDQIQGPKVIRELEGDHSIDASWIDIAYEAMK